jgi:hypothetical protein
MAYRTRKRRARKPAALHLYEVTYTIIGGEIEHHVYRLRCRKLTPAIMRSNKPLIGEVCAKLDARHWTPFGLGALPGVEAYNPRTVRELPNVDVPAKPAVEIIEGGKK